MLELTFLQSPFVVLTGKPVTGFVSDKAIALFAYLALNPGAHSREMLATLLWGELPDDRAKANLRLALHNIQKNVPAALDVTRKTAEFRPTDPYALDVALFESAFGANTATDLQAALDLYQSDLLTGLSIQGGEGFERWLRERREELRLKRLDMLTRLVDLQERERTWQSAGETMRQMLSIEPWHESMHQRLMLNLARQGRYAAAIAQYRSCTEVLEAELGVAPMPETTALFERIEALRQRSRHHLPPQATAFHGRESDLDTLADRLLEPNSRLLSLIGPGGIGKTRLSIALAERVKDRYLEGAIFIPLVGLSASENLYQHIIAVLSQAGLFTASQSDLSAEAYLETHLQGKELLLVLDNAEHLVDPVVDWIHFASRFRSITLLVTSRERLNLPQERAWRLDGFELADAAAFFTQAAGRHRPGFKLTPDILPDVHRICAQVDGMPLALELAAAWIRLFSCAQIADQVAGQLDMLKRRQRGTDQRHQSLSAVVEQSWRLLSAEEQTVMQRLSVFRGGIPLEAAQRVAEADIDTLLSLVDQSLLRAVPETHGEPRFELHEWVRQYAEGRLSPAELAATRQRHGVTFSEWLAALEPNLKNRHQAVSMNRIAAEINNIQAAWQWGIEADQTEITVQAGRTLCFYFLERSLYREGFALFSQAADSLEERPLDDVKARLLLYKSRFMFTLRQVAEAKALIESVQPTLVASPHFWEAALSTRGLSLMSEDRSAVIAGLKRSLEMFRQSGDLYEVATELLNLSAWATFAEKERFLSEAAKIYEQLGERLELARLLSFQGSFLRRHFGKLDQARTLFNRSLEIQINEHTHWIHLLYLQCAELEISANRLDEALAYVDQAETVYKAIYPNLTSYTIRLARLRALSRADRLSEIKPLLTDLNSPVPEVDNANQVIDIGLHHLYHALGLHFTGQTAASNRAFETAIELFASADLRHELALAWVEWGWHRLDTADGDQSRHAFTEAVNVALGEELRPMFYEACTGLVLVMSTQDKSIAPLVGLITAAPECDPYSRSRLAALGPLPQDLPPTDWAEAVKAVQAHLAIR